MSFDVSDRCLPRTIYVAEPLDLPPLTAGAAFDAFLQAALATGGAGEPLVRTPSAELHLDDTCPQEDDIGWRLRRAYGRIRRPGAIRGAGTAVEIEVVAWSNVRCEVGVRPVGRANVTSDSPRRRRYLALALAAAAGLAHALEDHVEDSIRVQLAGVGSLHPSPLAWDRPHADG